MPVLDQLAERILSDHSDIGGFPLCEINRRRLGGPYRIACTAYAGKQDSDGKLNVFHCAIALVNSRHTRSMWDKTVPSHVDAINIEAAVPLFCRPYDREGNARLQSAHVAN